MMASKRYAIAGADCVACGSCMKLCPMHAIWIDRGVTAKIDPALCVGCGKCAAECPASVISLVKREAAV